MVGFLDTEGDTPLPESFVPLPTLTGDARPHASGDDAQQHRSLYPPKRLASSVHQRPQDEQRFTTDHHHHHHRHQHHTAVAYGHSSLPLTDRDVDTLVEADTTDDADDNAALDALDAPDALDAEAGRFRSSAKAQIGASALPAFLLHHRQYLENHDLLRHRSVSHPDPPTFPSSTGTTPLLHQGKRRSGERHQTAAGVQSVSTSETLAAAERPDAGSDTWPAMESSEGDTMAWQANSDEAQYQYQRKLASMTSAGRPIPYLTRGRSTQSKSILTSPHPSSVMSRSGMPRQPTSSSNRNQSKSQSKSQHRNQSGKSIGADTDARRASSTMTTTTTAAAAAAAAAAMVSNGVPPARKPPQPKVEVHARPVGSRSRTPHALSATVPTSHGTSPRHELDNTASSRPSRLPQSRIPLPKRTVSKQTLDKNLLSTSSRTLFDLPITATNIGPYRLIDPYRGTLHQPMAAPPIGLDTAVGKGEGAQSQKENLHPFASPRIASSKVYQDQAAAIRRETFDQQAAQQLSFRKAAKEATKVLDVPLSHLNYPPKLPSPARGSPTPDERDEYGDVKEDDDLDAADLDRLPGPNGIQLYTKPRFAPFQPSGGRHRRRRHGSMRERTSHDQGAIRVRPGQEVAAAFLPEWGREPQRSASAQPTLNRSINRAHRHCSPDRHVGKTAGGITGALASVALSSNRAAPNGVINFEHLFWS